MADLVLSHLSLARKVADLFAGAGGFALRIAKKSEVHAAESDAAALAALDRGIRQATGLKRVTHERRDLFRRPLTFKELNAFDGPRLRPAARRRRGPVQANRPLRRSLCGRRVLQPRHARPRPRHPRRRRLPIGARRPDRPVFVVAACRGSCAAGEATKEALRLLSLHWVRNVPSSAKVSNLPRDACYGRDSGSALQRPASAMPRRRSCRRAGSRKSSASTCRNSLVSGIARNTLAASGRPQGRCGAEPCGAYSRHGRRDGRRTSSARPSGSKHQPIPGWAGKTAYDLVR